MKTIIVDRVKVYKQLIRSALKDTNTDLVMASSGQEAMSLLKNEVFDCICLSMYLDDINGIDLCKKIRKQSIYKYTPIVLLTSESEKELIKQANLAGITDIFLKDKTDELVGFIERFTQINEPLSGQVLYIEDFKSQRLAVSQIFKNRGLNVDAFGTAEEAWAAFIKNHYHLVVTDLVLSGEMSGVMLINKIRRIEGAKGKTPILALTAYDDAQRRVSLYHMGIADYVTKPIIEVELMARVSNLIKNQKALEQEVYYREQMNSEETMRRSMKMDAMGKLTGGIAHDNNNMLGVIIGYVELLEERLEDQPDLKKYISHIKKASQNSVKLTNKLLGFARKNETQAEVLNINHVISDIEEILKKALTAGIKLSINLQENIWNICANTSDLENSLMNLTINAKHAIGAKGSLSIMTQNIILSRGEADRLGLKSGEYVQLTVSDSGHGMSSETKEHIFDPFFTTKGDEGTGLGLSQAYGFAQRSHGAIDVISKEGRGTKFKLYFPRDISMLERDNFNNAVKKTSSDKRTSSVLVVDDNQDIAGLVKEILIDSGYSAEAAYDAREAINKFKHHSYDVMITDLVMPDLDGYELSARIKENHPEVKIVLTSGYEDNEMINNKTEKNYITRLQKPVSRNALIECMDKLNL